MSAGCFSNASCQTTTSPYKMVNDHHHPLLNNNNNNNNHPQGIVSILSSDFEATSTKIPKNSTSFSIRRTLSADMSSQKWLHNNGLPLKRVHSSQQLQVLGEDDNIDNNNDDNNNIDHDTNKGPAFEEIWSSIQADKRSWGSILSPSKNDGSGSDPGLAPPPYVHPLAKRTTSSLSEKSLEICTESLGSETGSDGFSYPSSEPEESDKDQEEEEEEEQEQEQEQEVEQQEEEVVVVVVEMKGNDEVSNYKCNNFNRGPTMSKRSMMVPPMRPSFPPPLPSLAHRDGGSNLHIRSHRQDGRLVVEAVAVPSQNCFRAQRQDGRLLLTLTNDDQDEDDVVDDDDMVLEDEINVEEETAVVVEKDEQEEEEEEEDELVIPRGVINVQRSRPTFTMSKLMELTSTRNKSTWPRNYNTTVIKTLNDQEEEIDEEEDEMSSVSQSLPPRPRVSTATAAAVALNAYEYYWRRSNSPAAAAVAMLKPLAGHQMNNNTCAPQVGKDDTKGNNKKLLFAAHNRKAAGALAQQEVVLVKAAGREGGANTGEKAEYLVPLMLRGCKQHKRSLLFWEPYCIATS